jgi:hypothetical protein
MLGAESGSLASSAIRALASAVLTTPTDLAVPCYQLPAYTGLVNSAILYPLTRTLFASRVRFPLAADLGLSLRMAERLAGVAHHFTAINQGEAPLWPVNEATVAGFTIDQFDVGPRIQPQPAGPDLNTIFPLVTGSLFSDIDAKAAFWQRFRQLPPARNPMRLHQPSGNLVVRSAAELAARTQATLHNRRCNIPHAREPLGPHCLRLSHRPPAPHHQPRPSPRRVYPALPGMGRKPHQHHRLRH